MFSPLDKESEAANVEMGGTMELTCSRLFISQLEKLRPRERRALIPGHLVPQGQSPGC